MVGSWDKASSSPGFVGDNSPGGEWNSTHWHVELAGVDWDGRDWSSVHRNVEWAGVDWEGRNWRSYKWSCDNWSGRYLSYSGSWLLDRYIAGGWNTLVGAWWEEEAAQEDEWAAAHDEKHKDPNDDSWGSVSLVVEYALLLTLVITGQLVALSAVLAYSISGASITARNACDALIAVEGETSCAGDTDGTVAGTTTNSTAEALTLEEIGTFTASLAVILSITVGASERADIAQSTSIGQHESCLTSGTSLFAIDWCAEGGASGDES